MNRSAIRELAFRLIYSREIQKEENVEEQIELFLEANEVEDKNAIEYINDVIKGIEKNKNEILVLIEKNLISRQQLIEGYGREEPGKQVIDQGVENLKRIFSKNESMIDDDGELYKRHRLPGSNDDQICL